MDKVDLLKEENQEDNKLSTPHKALNAYKEPKGGDRFSYGKALLEALNYKKDFAVYQLDAMLIKAVELGVYSNKELNKYLGYKFTPCEAADIILMSLGLLRGYDYHDKKNSLHQVKKRREKYILETNYFRNKPIPYSQADKNLKKNYRDDLRKDEDKCIKVLIDFLVGQHPSVLINSLNKRDIDYTKNPPEAILPIPHYWEDIAAEEPSVDGLQVSSDTNGSDEDILGADSSADSADNDKDDEIKSEKDNEQEEHHTQEKIDGDLNQGNQSIQKEETNNNHSETTYIQEGDKISIDYRENNIVDNDQVTIEIININPSINSPEKVPTRDESEDKPEDEPAHMPLRWKIGIVLFSIIGSCCLFLFIKPYLTRKAPLVQEILLFEGDFPLMPGYQKVLSIEPYPPEADKGDIKVITKNPELIEIDGHTIIAKPGWEEDANHIAVVIIQGGNAKPVYVTVTIIPGPDDRAKDDLPNSDTVSD